MQLQTDTHPECAAWGWGHRNTHTDANKQTNTDKVAKPRKQTRRDTQIHTQVAKPRGQAHRHTFTHPGCEAKGT